jgi:hypothetical protein
MIKVVECVQEILDVPMFFCLALKLWPGLIYSPDNSPNNKQQFGLIKSQSFSIIFPKPFSRTKWCNITFCISEFHQDSWSCLIRFLDRIIQHVPRAAHTAHNFDLFQTIFWSIGVLLSVELCSFLILSWWSYIIDVLVPLVGRCMLVLKSEL